MTPLAHPETELDLTLEVFEEFEIPCDIPAVAIPTTDCDRPAEWYVLYDCGHDRVMCTGHKDQTVRSSNGAHWLSCAQCYPGASFSPEQKPLRVVLVEPLKRVS